jgi:glycine dehydrogenase subunit 1
MTYVPHTEAERAKMLAAIGVGRTDELFDAVPAHVRFPKLRLPPPC